MGGSDIDSETGLSDGEVAERIADGRSNIVPEPPGRTLAQIIRANTFTTVNAIMIVLFVLVVISGNPRDGLFVGVVVSNSVIGVVQEVRARRELGRLQVVTEPRAVVVRDGTPRTIGTEQIVLDDLIELSLGGQVPVDGVIVSSTGLRMDESMLTGESLEVHKEDGEEVLSGSFVVAGNARVRATAVGADSYASNLATEAKTFTAARSQLRRGIDRILRWLTIIIPIASIFLFVSLLGEQSWQDALQGTVAAAVAMVPDGLVLLTSVAFMAGVIALARHNALASQLSTVEVLARVDVLCLDKTGTITTGDISFAAIHSCGDQSETEIREILAALSSADRAPNATMAAIVDEVGSDTEWIVDEVEPFNSTRKWAAASFVDRCWFFIGAPEFLIAEGDSARALAEGLSASGKRILAVGSSESGPEEDSPAPAISPLAIVELEDEIRPDAPEILAYFADQDVTLKVISGDNPETVAAIAERAGLELSAPPVDARSLSDDLDQMADQLENGVVFGRVAPRQKQAMVRALQHRNHVVAMTGDGVNDVLALKEADLGISMGSGSEATRSVADLVLTDDSFSSLPVVVGEGRKVINNVERVSNLFVTKAAYAVLLTFAVGLIGSPFPFLPRQLTLIGTFSIGIPGVFLALAPETDLVRPGFLRRVLWFSVPAGIAAGSATLAAFEASQRITDLDLDEARTLATVTLMSIGLVVLAVSSRPLRLWKIGLVASMAAAFAVTFMVPWLRDYFELDLFVSSAWGFAIAAVVIAGTFIILIPFLFHSKFARQPE